MILEEYLLDTGWGCGLIIVQKGKVINSALIFKKLIDRSIQYLEKCKSPKTGKYYKLVKLK